jgi:hypothetical protein
LRGLRTSKSFHLRTTTTLHAIIRLLVQLMSRAAPMPLGHPGALCGALLLKAGDLNKELRDKNG